MVVRIRSGKSIQGALSYNEEKVRLGKAEMILAAGFGCEIDNLGFSQKLKRFQLLNSRDPKTETNTLHLSLNFSPQEQLSDEKLQLIAIDYMNQIGFGEQPFLVYQHNDTNHPHIHIVTTSIQSNGIPINQHNLAKRLSEPARKAIEIQYGLIQAEGRDNAQDQSQPFNLSDKAETKHKITNIVGEVMRSYAFTSLDEFNFILRQFNVLADRGRSNSQMYHNRGLVYTLLDDKGFRKGVSIKASEIYENPILANIEKKFTANNVKKIARREAVLSRVQQAFNLGKSPDHIVNLLAKNKIKIHFDLDTIGAVKSIYFIDSKSKVILNQNEFGLNLPDLLQKLVPQAQIQKPTKYAKPKNSLPETSYKESTLDNLLGTYSTTGLIHAIFKSSPGFQGPAPEPIKKKKKKKRRP